MPETRILIVDDEDIVAGEIQTVLTYLGYSLIERAVSAEEAIACVEACMPDLVLMDITLQGGMDGIKAAELIHKRWDVPVIYLTAHDDESTLQHAKVSDPFGYLLKPFKQRELHIAIEMALYRHRTEQRLRELNLQLQEASRYKNDFLANMSHELRTPLNAMIGYTSLTLHGLKESLPPEHLKNLTRAEQSARLLLQLINDVLDFSKIEAGRFLTFIEDVDLDELLEEVVMTAEGLLSGKTVELIEDISSDLPTLESDYTRLKQILDNLVGNAIKFTEHGHVAIRASVLAGTGAAKKVIEIVVEDTGCGIPAEVLEHIFDLFRQADGCSIKKKFSGTGLGLAISKRLSEMLGISIDLTSQVEQGTRFCLHVPVIFHAEAAKDAGDSESAGSVSKTVPSFHDGVITPARVSQRKESESAVKALVLCLSQIPCETSIKRQLAGLPLEVAHVLSVRECRDYAANQFVWSIVLESGEDDVTMLAQLNVDESLKSIPIIMAPPHTDRHGHGVGSVDYGEYSIQGVAKPVTSITQAIALAGNRSILLVDDNEMNVNLMSGVFESSGYTVYEASSARQGLELAHRVLPDTIVMDLAMPVMDGFEATESLKRDPATADITVIACSAFATSEYKERALRAGCEGYITKPIEPNRLVEQVTRFMLNSKITKKMRQTA